MSNAASPNSRCSAFIVRYSGRTPPASCSARSRAALRLTLEMSMPIEAKPASASALDAWAPLPDPYSRTSGGRVAPIAAASASSSDRKLSQLRSLTE